MLESLYFDLHWFPSFTFISFEVLYYLQTGLASENECWQCKPGKYCSGYGNKVFPSASSGDCDAGFYCKLGVNTPRPSDNYTGIGGVCPKGSYCPKGTAEPIGCPNGTFSNVSGLEKEADCTPCLNGHYCGESNLTAPTGTYIK